MQSNMHKYLGFRGLPKHKAQQTLNLLGFGCGLLFHNKLISYDGYVCYALAIDFRERLFNIESALKVCGFGSLFYAKRVVHSLQLLFYLGLGDSFIMR